MLQSAISMFGGPSNMVPAKITEADIGTGALLGFGNILPIGEESNETSLPGEGDFSVASITDKAGEVVESVADAGSAVVDRISGFFNGDNTKTLSTIKDALPVPTNNAAANADQQDDINGQKYFVSLRSYLNDSDRVVFNVTPQIDEARTASYEEVGVTHHPGQILRYKTTSARQWTVNVKLISRTPAEASENLTKLNLIRSWLMPYFGNGTKNSFKDNLGAPPDILEFSAYGSQMIEPHPVVLESFNTSFPPDIDYIHTEANSKGEKVPFPVILTLALTLKEAWAPTEFAQFDLAEYRKGNLTMAFRSESVNASLNSPSLYETYGYDPATAVPTAAEVGEPIIAENYEGGDGRFFNEKGEQHDPSTGIVNQYSNNPEDAQ